MSPIGSSLGLVLFLGAAGAAASQWSGYTSTASSTTTPATSASAIPTDTSQSMGGESNLNTTSQPVVTDTGSQIPAGDGEDPTCTNTDIVPTDLPTYPDHTTENDITYKVTNISGLIVDVKSPHFILAPVYGPSHSDQSNSWELCTSQCFDWCDSHPNCHSFNVFTFEEGDYPQGPCVPTCGCRTVDRAFNKEDYRIDLPFMELEFPSQVFEQQVHCFNQTCCYNPHGPAYDPCLWEAADIPGFILNFYNNSEAKDKNLLYDIAGLFAEDYNCTVTDITGCPQSYHKPEYNEDPNRIRAFLAFIAIRRQMLYMKAALYLNQHTLDTVISTNVSNLLTDFTTNVKTPPIIDQTSIDDGMSILAAAMSIIGSLAPEAWGVSTGFSVFSELIGLGPLTNLNADYAPPPVDVLNLGNYLNAVKTNTSVAIETAAANFLDGHNTSHAVYVLDFAKGKALNETPEHIWLFPDASLPFMEALVTKWAISRTLTNIGLFIHWEDYTTSGLGKDQFDQLAYPGQTYIGNNFTYPVYYYANSNDDTPHTIRRYDPVGLLGKWDLDFASIANASYYCQRSWYNAQASPIKRGPTVAGLDFATAVALNPDISTYDIPCFWNLPVCDSTLPYLIEQCTNDQCVCASHSRNGGGDMQLVDGVTKVGSGPFKSRSLGNWGEGADNFPLDDWCAVELNGKGGLWGSTEWGKATSFNNNPFGEQGDC